MNFNEMDQAVKQAENTIKTAEMFSHKMATFLIGRLRNVHPSTLKRLKSELSKFNVQTGEWK